MMSKTMTSVRWMVVALLVLSCGSAEKKMLKFYEKGKTLYAQDQLVKARLEFKNAVQIDPRFALGFYYLGLVERKSNDYQKAFSYFSTAIQLDDNLMDAHVAIGKLFMEVEEVQKALEKAEFVLSKVPGHMDATLLKVAVYLQQNKRQSAKGLLDKLIKDGYQDTDIYFLRALTALQEKKSAGALQILEDGILKHPNSVKLYTLISGVYAGIGNAPAAETAMKKIIAFEPGNIDHQWKLIDLLWQTGQETKALNRQQEIVSRHPNDEDQWLHAAQLSVSHGKKHTAEDLLKKGLSIIPKSYNLCFALSQIYLRENRADDAVELLTASLSFEDQDDSPNMIQAKNLLVRALMAEGNMKMAEELVDQVLNSNPKNVDAHYLKGQFYMLRRKGAEAVSEFRTVVVDRPEIVDGHLRLAEAYLLNKENELALDALINASNDLPGAKEIRQALAQMYMIQKDYASSEKQYTKILTDDPNDLFAHMGLGKLFDNAGRYKSAEAQYQKIIKLFPQNQSGYIELSQLYKKTNAFDKATGILKKGITAVRDPETLMTQLVTHYLENQKYNDALCVCESQLKKGDNVRLIYNLMGVVFMAKKDYDNAQTALNKAVEIDPMWPVPYRNLAQLSLEQGKLKEAITKLNASLAVNYRNPGAYLALGKLYEQNKNYEEAIQVYEKALSVYPNMWAAANNLAYLLCENGNFPDDLERAAIWGEKVASMRPNDPVIQDTQAWIAFKQGHIEQAKQILEDALKKIPEHPELNYHMGAILAKSGQVIEARQKLMLALSGNSQFHGRKEAQILLAKINQ